MLIGEAANTNFIVLGLTRPVLKPTIYITQPGLKPTIYITRPGLKPTIYITQGKHANNDIMDVVIYLAKFIK